VREREKKKKKIEDREKNDQILIIYFFNDLVSECGYCSLTIFIYLFIFSFLVARLVEVGVYKRCG
jgi:hypothetical protein